MDSDLHPDQDKYKNFTISQAKAIQRCRLEAVRAVDCAVAELEAWNGANFDAGDKAAKWENSFFHCWWGPWDSSRFNDIVFQHHLIKAVLTDDRLRFKLTRNHGGVAIPYTRTMRLSDMVDKLQMINILGLIVHEAAHLSGVAVVPAREKYFRHQVIEKAQKRPNFVLRNASNYEHFSVDCYRIRVLKEDLRTDPYCKKALISACGYCT